MQESIVAFGYSGLVQLTDFENKISTIENVHSKADFTDLHHFPPF